MYVSPLIIGALGATAFWALVLFIMAILKSAGK